MNDNFKRTLSWMLRDGDAALDRIEGNAVRNKLLERQLPAEDQPGGFCLKIDVCAVGTE
jgi:hypothetical protein